MTMLLLLILLAHECSLGKRVEGSCLNTPRLTNMVCSLRSHLPLMFVGMEHIMLSNQALADEALNASNQICDGDPLLVNERGVMAFNHGEFVCLFVLCTAF
jgi:hypothetical protein